jgi:hypothetical protein
MGLAGYSPSGMSAAQPSAGRKYSRGPKPAGPGWIPQGERSLLSIHADMNRFSESDRVLAILRAAARREPNSRLLAHTQSVDLLLEASSRHGLDHVLLDWLRLAVAEREHPALGALQERNRRAANFHLRVLGALRTALDSLMGTMAVVVLKGPVLAALGGTRSVRTYGDLDLLIAPASYLDALEALEGIGATLFPYGGWRGAFETRHAQLPLLLPLGVGLDLHWHLCSEPGVRNSFSVDSADRLLSRAGRLELGIGAIPVLDPHDMVIHTAAHAGWSGGDRLGWLVDVDATIGRVDLDLDWDVIVRRAQAWKLDHVVRDVLRRTAHEIGTAIPAEVLRPRHLTPMAFVLEKLDAGAPIQAIGSGYSAARLTRIYLRSTLRSTAWAVGVQAVAAARRRLSPPPPPSTVDGLPGSFTKGADDERWRDSYLGWVVTEGQRCITREQSEFHRWPGRPRSWSDASAQLRSLAIAAPLSLTTRRRLQRVGDLDALLGGLDLAGPSRRRRTIDTTELVRATDRCLRLLRSPDRSCVHRSLVLYAALVRAGDEPTFVSGVRRISTTAGGTLIDGHAWIESSLLPLAVTGNAGSPALYSPSFRHSATQRKRGRTP